MREERAKEESTCKCESHLVDVHELVGNVHQEITHRSEELVTES